MKQKTKIILYGTLIATTIAAVSTTAWILVDKNKKFMNKVNSINKFINENLNNFSKPQDFCNEFVKGVDISTYCEVIENFLFQNDIRKNDGSLYKYDEIFNNYYQEGTLDDFINLNFFSYFKNGKRVFANLFEILNYYGINSIRIKVWNNPYDENGNSFGGGTNDLKKAIWLINESRKYGINDFLIDYHYSDFWADPKRQFLPREWMELDQTELEEAIYQYTYESSKQILDNCDDQTRVTFQIGNEITNGIFWKSLDDENKKSRIELETSLLKKGIDAIYDLGKELNLHNENENKNLDKKIKVVIHYADTFNNLLRYEPLYDYIDGIHLSFYPLFHRKHSYENEIMRIKNLNEKFPHLELYIGEYATNYKSSSQFYLLNQETTFEKLNEVIWRPSVESQLKLTFDIMNTISNLLPNLKTGFYYWEPANIMIGANKWTSKEGLQHLKNYENVEQYRDTNTWSANCLFDANGIALPALEVIKQFSRKPAIDTFNVYDSEDVVEKWSQQSELDKLINNKSKFLFEKDFVKIDLKDAFIKDYTNQVYDDNQKINIYLNEINDSIENELIKKIKYFYSSIMYKLIEFKNFYLSDDGTWGSIEAFAIPNNFYYTGNIKFWFNVHENYFVNTKTINNLNEPLKIKSNDEKWYEKIIERLKKQDDYKFSNDIWEFLKISGGGNDNNQIWLYDENKLVNRDAEFFLLKDDKIRYRDNTVNFDVLQINKIWVDTLGQKYKLGKNKIYFGIRKKIEDMNLKWNIDSTFSKVGMESWKYVDILIYEIDIDLI